VTREVRSEPYKVRAAAGVVVFDGVKGSPFTIRTLYVGSWPATGAFPSLDAPVAAPSSIGFELVGLHKGAPYLRRFTLGAGAQIAIPVSAFDDLRLTVLYAQIAGGAAFDAVGITSSEQTEVNRDDVLVYVDERAAAGVYPVPPGAMQLAGVTADANFAWQSRTFSGAVATVNTPIGPGTLLDVRGTNFQTTVAAWSGVWRIRL
jgi:hypothetical protein